MTDHGSAENGTGVDLDRLLEARARADGSG